MDWKLALVAVTLGVTSACSSSDDPIATPTTSTVSTSAEDAPETEALTTTPTDVATTTTVRQPSESPTAPSTTLPPTTLLPTTAPSTTLPPTTAAPVFVATVSEITPSIRDRMTSSWRQGCPVGLDGLRHIELSHWNYDGRVSTGELIVAEPVADDIVEVFAALFADGFPIERMELVDVYDSDDDLSMAANNTSAFNCREVAWRPGVWSNHAFGQAIDINPLVNPYVSSTRLLPPEGAAYADRSIEAPGLIRADDVVVQAFTSIGWGWGGAWQSAKDYQHFSSTGR